LEIRRSTGTVTKAGSAVAARRSTAAIFSASIIRCVVSAVPKPSRRTSNASIRFSICATWTPPVAGGWTPTMSTPR
jgi:hypothetical protein